MGLAITNDGSKAYVSTVNDGTITIFDMRTAAIIGTPVTLGGRITDIALSPDGTRLYAIDFGPTDSPRGRSTF